MPDQFAHHAPLVFVRLAQDGVQRGDDGHLQFAQQRQHMAARRPAENPELMLHANHVHVRDVQEIRRAQIRRQILLRDLEPHFRRIIITFREIIDRHDEALQLRKFLRHGAAQIGRERGDAAFSRQIIAKKRDFVYIRWLLHETLSGGTFTSHFAALYFSFRPRPVERNADQIVETSPAPLTMDCNHEGFSAACADSFLRRKDASPAINVAAADASELMVRVWFASEWTLSLMVSNS